MAGVLRTVPALTSGFLLLACSPGDVTENANAPGSGNETETVKQTNASAPAMAVEDEGDAKVPGTDFHATTEIPCSTDGTAPSQSCFAGVKRKWGEDGTTLVEITKPDGYKRAIFFHGAEAYGADGAEADGSSGFTFTAAKEGDESAISYGPERYRIPDALVMGG